MTLDEAIKHCLEVAEKNDGEAEVYNLLAKNHNNTYEKLTASKFYTDCAECAAYHRQLAEWLTELKELKTKYSDVQEKIREIRGYLEFAQEHMNVLGVLEALDIIKDIMNRRTNENESKN